MDEKQSELKERLLEVVERMLNAEEKMRDIDVANELLKIVVEEYDI